MDTLKIAEAWKTGRKCPVATTFALYTRTASKEWKWQLPVNPDKKLQRGRTQIPILQGRQWQAISIPKPSSILKLKPESTHEKTHQKTQEGGKPLLSPKKMHGGNTQQRTSRGKNLNPKLDIPGDSKCGVVQH